MEVWQLALIEIFKKEIPWFALGTMAILVWILLGKPLSGWDLIPLICGVGLYLTVILKLRRYWYDWHKNGRIDL